MFCAAATASCYGTRLVPQCRPGGSIWRLTTTHYKGAMQGLSGRLIWRHELRERIGCGAMGEVYRALHVGFALRAAFELETIRLVVPGYYTYIRLEDRVMHRKLTITIDDEVYKGLHQRVGRGNISQFIEQLVRPHVVDTASLEAEYREAAADVEAEAEAMEWIEWSPDEALD